jgi:hypothetical protein
MKHAELALTVLLLGTACRSGTDLPFVPDRLSGTDPARVNIVLYLSSCTPCGSAVYDGVAAFAQAHAASSHLVVITHRGAPSAGALLRARLAEDRNVAFVHDGEGALVKSAGVPSLPFLVIYDDRKHLLRAEAISASSAASACLADEITALTTIPAA